MRERTHGEEMRVFRLFMDEKVFVLPGQLCYRSVGQRVTGSRGHEEEMRVFRLFIAERVFVLPGQLCYRSVAHGVMG